MKSEKGIASLLLVVAVIFVAALGFYLYQNNQIKQTTTLSTSPAGTINSSIGVASPAPTIDPNPFHDPDDDNSDF